MLNNYTGFVVWLTGLSGSGKTTIWKLLKNKLLKKYNIRSELLDGDVIRTNLSKGLSFTKEDRDINVRRVGFVCNLLSRNNIPVIASLISPYKDVRNELKNTVHRFVEVYVNASIEECEKRDVKGLYKMVRDGQILNFTGITDPYEKPENPDVICNTELETPEESVEFILNYLKNKKYIEIF